MVQAVDDGCFIQADSSRLRKQSIRFDIRKEEEKYSKMVHGINYC